MDKIAIYALLDTALRIRWIGQSSCPEGRYKTHRKRKPWVRLMRIIEWTTVTEWPARERFWIAYGRRHGWPLENIADGGQGHPITIATREKMRQAALGKKKSPEAIANSVAARKAGKGWMPSAETRAKMSASHLGKVLPMSTREKMRLAHAKHETKEKNRIAHLGRIPWNKGLRTGIPTIHTPEAIEKMRQARLVNPTRFWLGKKLPQSVRDNMKKAWIKRKEKTNVARSSYIS